MAWVYATRIVCKKKGPSKMIFDDFRLRSTGVQKIFSDEKGYLYRSTSWYPDIRRSQSLGATEELHS